MPLDRPKRRKKAVLPEQNSATNQDNFYHFWKQKIPKTQIHKLLPKIQNLATIVQTATAYKHTKCDTFRQTKKTTIQTIRRLQKQIQHAQRTFSPTRRILPFLLFTASISMVHAITQSFLNNKRHQKLRQQLHALNINTKTYTWTRFNQNHVIYIKVSKESLHTYIGMTIKGMAEREDSRKRKYLQLTHDKFINCEPAIRFWYHTKTYHRFIPIVIATANSKTLTLAKESFFIEHWQPSLNVPFIGKFEQTNNEGKRKVFTFPKTQFKSKTTFTKLWRKLRTRMAAKEKPWRNNLLENPDIKEDKTNYNNKLQTWICLFRLTQCNLNRFLTQKFLRGPNTADETLYALWRQTQYMEEPHKSKTCGQLRLIMKYRNLRIPKFNKPLIIQKLAHNDFQKDLTKWISQTIQENKEDIIPFHLPCSTPLFCRHQPLSLLLHNWKHLHRNQSSITKDTCPCKAFCEKYSNTTTYEGHVMASAEEIPELPQKFQHILCSSSKDTVYPSKTVYQQKTLDNIRRWCKHHDIQEDKTINSWNTFLDQQWPIHLKHIEQQDLHSFKDIAQLKLILQGFIIQCEDHAPTKLSVFCPKVYLKLHQQTMSDPAVFRVHHSPPSTVQQTILKHFPKPLRKRYKWGIKPQQPLPTCYIFPKRKKQFKKARPVITFYKTQFSILYKALGKLIHDLTRKVYPESFHRHSTTKTFQNLHHFLSKNKNNADDLVWKNDDIKGFFTSVPHDTIITSFHHMIQKYAQENQHTQASKIFFSVDYTLPAKTPRTIQGKTFKSKSVAKIWLQDIIPLVQLSLQTSVFTSLGKVHSQKRGSCIGNPASPPISEVPIAFKEFMWKTTFNIHYDDSFFLTRYVDNRLLAIPKEAFLHKPWRLLVDLMFYDSPVELEPEPGMEFLGFTIDKTTLQVQYITPDKTWQFRSKKSAGSTKELLTGLVSRIYLIIRHTHPKFLIKPSIQTLFQAYQKQGFHHDELKAASHHVLRKFNIHLPTEEGHDEGKTDN